MAGSAFLSLEAWAAFNPTSLTSCLNAASCMLRIWSRESYLLCNGAMLSVHACTDSAESGTAESRNKCSERSSRRKISHHEACACLPGEALSVPVTPPKSGRCAPFRHKPLGVLREPQRLQHSDHITVLLLLAKLSSRLLSPPDASIAPPSSCILRCWL